MKTKGLIVLMMMLFVAMGCGKDLSKAHQTIDAISAARTNLLIPIYDIVLDAKCPPDPAECELETQIEAFDAEFRGGIASTYEVLILIESGGATYADYLAKIQALVSILDRYKVEERIPELAPGIRLAKQILGVEDVT